LGRGKDRLTENSEEMDRTDQTAPNFNLLTPF